MKISNKISFLSARSFIRRSLFIFICFSFLLVGRGEVFAQNKNIDSILILFKTDKIDTNKVNHSSSLCLEFLNIGLYDTAIHYGNVALQIGQQLNFKKGIASSYSNMGIVYYYRGDYPKTLDYWLKALSIYQELKNKKGIASLQGNIGAIYYGQADYFKALNYYFKALKMQEELGDKKGVAGQLNNIGLVYWNQGDYTKALDYYFKALKIAEALCNKQSIAKATNNIGIVYGEQKDYAKALTYFLKVLKIDEELKNKNDIEKLLGNIGTVYYNQRDYPMALGYYLKELKIAEELGDKKETASTLANIGNVCKEQKDYIKALDYDLKALKIAEEMEDKKQIAATLFNVSTIYTEQKKYKEAYGNIYRALTINNKIGAKEAAKKDYEMLGFLYEKATIHLPDSIDGKLLTLDQMRLRSMHYYKQSIAIRDTLFSQEKKKQLVRKEMNYEYEKKEGIAKKESEKRKEIVEEKSRIQKIIIFSVAGGLLLVLVLASFIFYSLRVTRKQKRIIEEKNKLVEEKNKDITDRIRYAKRIQDALLREEEHISMHLPEHFILFMPKDIVSGDFYWGAEKDEYWYFAAVDCTGHGVPGAVMSMLGISFLNEIVSQELLCPAEILNRLRDKVVKELRQTGEAGGSKDGMDISLARLNLKTNELQWAGANNSLNLIQNGQLGIVKADKQPIGYHPNSGPFTNHEIQLQKGDSIYLYSDGYADQFGGPKGKKFKYKQLDNLIITHKHLPMKDQKVLLKKSFLDWKGDLEQVDDVCVFGVKI